MSNEPYVDRSGLVKRPKSLLMLLHGGAEESDWPGCTRPAWLQIKRLKRGLLRPAADLEVGVWAVRNRFAGWNDDVRPPAPADARGALALLRRECGDLPVVVVGHSMGGRTGIRVADDPSVLGVIGLAPLGAASRVRAEPDRTPPAARLRRPGSTDVAR